VRKFLTTNDRFNKINQSCTNIFLNGRKTVDRMDYPFEKQIECTALEKLTEGNEREMKMIHERFPPQVARSCMINRTSAYAYVAAGIIAREQ